MPVFSAPQNTIATNSVSSSPPAVTRPDCEPARPMWVPATVTVTIVPHMNTSPWAKLISSMMP